MNVESFLKVNINNKKNEELIKIIKNAQNLVKKLVKPKKTYTEDSIAHALALSKSSPFNFQTNLIVPNVYWGWKLNYEADLIVITSSRYVHEIEIKLTKQDLKNDFNKKIYHEDRLNRISYLWYAGPIDMLQEFIDKCPENAGIITVEYKSEINEWKVKVHRNPKANNKSKKITSYYYSKLARLGTIKYWNKK